MPNWTNNELFIFGSKKDIQAFKKKAKNKDTDLSLNNFIPLPKELINTSSPAQIVEEKDLKKEIEKAEKTAKKYKLEPSFPITKKIQKELIRKYGFDNWYDWQVANWGTKWDIDAELVYESEVQLEYNFLSAWSPPIAWLETAVKLFPELQFLLKYDEGGMAFMGVAKATRGKVINKSIDY